MSDGSLNTLALKLGLTASTTRRKAEELVRLLEVKGNSGMALSSSARAIICLDIAASLTGATVDKKLAVRLSGMTRPKYVTLSQTVACLLNLSPKITVSELCVTLSATSATHLAQEVLALYEKQNVSRDVDFSQPIYPTVAVLAACRVLKVRVDKQRLYESSVSKRKVYQRLVEVMMPLAQELHMQKMGSGGNKRSRTLVELVEENLKQCSPEKKMKTKSSEQEETCAEEDFDEWKKKILEASVSFA